MIVQQIIIYTEKTAMILMYMWKDSIDKKNNPFFILGQRFIVNETRFTDSQVFAFTVLKGENWHLNGKQITIFDQFLYLNFCRIFNVTQKELRGKRFLLK